MSSLRDAYKQALCIVNSDLAISTTLKAGLTRNWTRDHSILTLDIWYLNQEQFCMFER